MLNPKKGERIKNSKYSLSRMDVVTLRRKQAVSDMVELYL